jgi:pimeloyl-ACP methyl ester carboxylesterase
MMRPRILPALVLGVSLGAGCDRLTGGPAADSLQRAGLHVAPSVLERYVGTYRLPSGAHFPVVRDGDRLLGGTPPHELLAQTTRQFRSNRLPGEFHFERSGPDGAVSLRRRLGDRDYDCKRVDPSVARDPTIRVAAGEHQLRMLIAGGGGPTIVLEDGIGNGIDWQAELQAELAKLSTVVSYDHAGTGGSDPGPAPRDARRVARELRLALQNAGLAPPFVLMGGSLGAEYIRIFAHEYPADTAGLILLDPAPDWDRLDKWAEVHAPSRVETYRRFARDANALMKRLMDAQETGRSAEWAALETTRAQARQAFPLPEVPLVQITGAGGRQTSPAMIDKVRFFDAWLREHLPHAKHVLAPHSGHAVPITDRKLVLDEVEQMLMSLRQRPDQGSR